MSEQTPEETQAEGPKVALDLPTLFMSPKELAAVLTALNRPNPYADVPHSPHETLMDFVAELDEEVGLWSFTFGLTRRLLAQTREYGEYEEIPELIAMISQLDAALAEYEKKED